MIYGEKTGTQPKGKMEIYSIPQSLPGHPDCGTIQIIYNIPPGIQVWLGKLMMCSVLFYIYLHHDSILFLTITFLGEVNKWTESSASGPYEPAKCFHPADWHQHPTAFVMSITDSFLCVEMVLSLPRAALSTHHLNALFVCRVLSTQTQGSHIRAEDSLASVSFLTMTKEER